MPNVNKNTIRHNIKKLIDNKIYDIKSAKPLATWENGNDDENFHYLGETLYQTNKGNMFLHARGGALTHLASRSGTSTGRGEEIYPLNLEQALEWCSRTDNAAAAMEHFSKSLSEA